MTRGRAVPGIDPGRARGGIRRARRAQPRPGSARAHRHRLRPPRLRLPRRRPPRPRPRRSRPRPPRPRLGAAEVRRLPHRARRGLRQEPARPLLATRRRSPDPEDMCSTCHGDGTKHIEGGGDRPSSRLPRAPRARRTASPATTAKNERARLLRHRVHANTAAVNCLSCHSIHSPAQKSDALLAKAPGALCATCHTTQTASFQNKPYAHRLDRGGMTCLDCHAPHASKGQTVKMTTQGELAVPQLPLRDARTLRLRPRHGLGRATASPATSRTAPTTRTCSSGRASSSSACPATRRPAVRGRSARSLRRSMT